MINIKFINYINFFKVFIFRFLLVHIKCSYMFDTKLICMSCHVDFICLYVYIWAIKLTNVIII